MRRLQNRSDTVYYWAERFDLRVRHKVPLLIPLVSAASLLLAGWELWPALSAALGAGMAKLKTFAWDNTAGILLSALGLILARYSANRKVRVTLDVLRRITIERDFGFSPAKIKLASQYTEAGFTIQPYANGVGLWSTAFNEWIFTRSEADCLPIALDLVEFSKAKDTVDVLAPRLATDLILHGKHFSNDLKVRLKSDNLFSKTPIGPVVLERTDYITTLCTNDMVGKLALGREDAPLVAPYCARTSMLDPKGTLRDWAEIDFANQLGASTIAFTSDGCMLLVEQTANNIQSANLLAPSGSGSFDWSDFENSEGEDFIEFCARAAQRELLEELGLEPLYCGQNVPIALQPIGFGLYIHRGAKPEILFLARLGITAADYLKIFAFSSLEKTLSKNRTPRADYSLGKSGWNAEAVSSACQRLRDSPTEAPRLSMPLEMALDMTIHACQTYPSVIDALKL